MRGLEAKPLRPSVLAAMGIGLLWLGFGGTTLGAVAGAAPELPRFLTRFWQVEDGLPENRINALVQTRDGYIWVGTSSGLARFDGVKFDNFDESNTPELKDSKIFSLFEDAAGYLWIGHETGELTRYKDGRFESIAIHPVWSKPRIRHMGGDSAGDLWLVNDEGLAYRMRDGQTQSPQAGGLARFSAFERSADGRMWFARDGVLSAFENGGLTPLLFDQSSLANSYVQGVCPSSDGGLWVASESHLRKWKGNKWVADLGVCPWQYSSLTRLVEMRGGLLAVGTTDYGLYLIQPHGKTVCFNHESGLRSDWVRSLLEDREGNLWVGTSTAGLVMLHPSSFVTLDPPDHWQDRSVLSLAAGTNGGLWITTDGAGLYHFHDGQWMNWRPNASEFTPYLLSVSADSQGQVWLGTWGDGMMVKHGDRFETAPGWQKIPTTVAALLRRSDGDYWVGTGRGLLRYRDGKITSPVKPGQAPFLDVRAVAEETNGVVWFGMNGQGLGRLQNGRVRQYRKSDGLASDFVSCLHLDDEGGLWIGTSGGLNRFQNGRFATIKAEQGLPNSVICNIEDDGRGCFWISSHGGILRVQKQELKCCADGEIPSARFWRYDKSDGLPTQECSGGFQPAGLAGTNGWLYFPTTKGLAAVNPDEITTNPLPPPVALEEVLVDDRRASNSLNADWPLKISPGRHRFEFRYTALSFTAPEKVKFKYHLDGIDADWMSAGTKRAVNYNYLPPGHYTFHVIACNNDKVWNDRGAEIAFTVLPYVWQTTWFRILALAALVGAASAGVWYGTRRRMRGKLERLERQRAVERERARIAKDIHDDLGANLTRINLLSQSVRREINRPGEAIKDVERIGDSARHMIRTMDEIVWAVDPQHDTLDSLTSYLGKVAQELMSAAGIRCRLDFPAQLPSWPLTAEVRHNLFLAFKEAVHNTAKHSAASEVRISLVIEPAGFTLMVEDNGCGFDPELLVEKTAPGTRRSLRNGLANMRQRMREIGGDCDIQSGRGSGTRLKFHLPVKEPAG